MAWQGRQTKPVTVYSDFRASRCALGARSGSARERSHTGIGTEMSLEEQELTRWRKTLQVVAPCRDREILKGNAFFKNDFKLGSNHVPCELFWKQTGSQLRMLCWIIHHRTSCIRILRVCLPPLFSLETRRCMNLLRSWQQGHRKAVTCVRTFHLHALELAFKSGVLLLYLQIDHL